MVKDSQGQGVEGLANETQRTPVGQLLQGPWGEQGFRSRRRLVVEELGGHRTHTFIQNKHDIKIQNKQNKHLLSINVRESQYTVNVKFASYKDCLKNPWRCVKDQRFTIPDQESRSAVPGRSCQTHTHLSF